MKEMLSYWRNSLCDADRLALNPTKIENKQKISFQYIEQGKLPEHITRFYFKEEDTNTCDIIDILLCPVVSYLKTNHGNSENSSLRELIPIWVPAKLHRSGFLNVNPEVFPWIPRDYLAPSLQDLHLGTLESMDAFLSTNSCPTESWSEFWKYVLNYFKYVTGQNLKDFKYENYKNASYSYISSEKISQGMSKTIIDLYDEMLKNNYTSPLLQQYTAMQDVDVKPCLNHFHSIKKSIEHMGQMSNEYPVSISQRDTIHHFLTLNEGEMLAVNGPPGTGKTTLLQSIIASMWVKAAYNKTEPPVIVVSSTNNQAVTNVIDSFGNIKETCDSKELESLQNRWLPDVNSYGLYLSSTSKEENPKFQTIFSSNGNKIGFFQKLESKEYVMNAEIYFIKKCEFYANTNFSSIQDAINYLHTELKQIVETMQNVTRTYLSVLEIRKKQNENYPNGIENTLQDKEIILDKFEAESKQIQKLELDWKKHLYAEPWWLSALSFFPFIKKKKHLRDQMFILEKGLNNVQERGLAGHIDNLKSSNQMSLLQIDHEVQNIKHDMQRLKDLEIRLIDSYKQLNIKDLVQEDLLSGVDCTYRYKAFKLATHYWEGRWLIQMKEQFLEEYKESKAKFKQEMRWRRYAKLTPCFVSTLYMVPSFFKAWEESAKPLYEYIDLLIIDEAGQVSPEIAGASFALAKKALVVGDTLQIEPVWSATNSTDVANIMKAGLASSIDKAEQNILDKKLGASCGSVMHIAQRASKYQKYEGIKGMYLTEHRRCVPEIINYCNELAYTGRLEPKRNSLESFPLPHMGYAHISGTAERLAGSRQNISEATVIVKWIQDNQDRLKELYKKHNIKKIEDIIAIITPFLRQKLLIKQELKKIGLKDITVGTVHALQGAERPIVIFSPVYDSNETKEYFFDSGVNMLNVAVSRAKDSFLVFGDMRIFNKNATSPSGLLARYLFTSESNEIKNIEVPNQFISNINIPVEHIRDLESHRNILKNSLNMAQKEVHIVSPFLSWNAIEQDELDKLFADVIYRGIKIHVYTDEQLNEYQGKKRFNFIKAKDILSTLGVNVHILDRIHNKTLWVDDSLLIEGSFNWLSARRQKDDPWCRYETSLLYRGTGVEDMITKVYKDLRGKEKYPILSNQVPGIH